MEKSKKKKTFNPEEEAQALEFYDMGHGVSTVSLKMNCSHGLIDRLVKAQRKPRSKAEGIRLRNELKKRGLGN